MPPTQDQTGPTPAREYQNRLATQRQLLENCERGEERIANLRLAVFVAGVAWALYAWWYHPALMSGALLPVGGFVCLVILHERTHRRVVRARCLVDFYEQGVARLEGNWADHGDTGEEFLADDHPYAADLDLLGKGSVFQLLSRSNTRTGAATLAKWLLHPASRQEARERRTAVEELRSRLDLREELALQGLRVARGVHPESLSRWAFSEEVFHSATLQRAATVLAPISIAALIFWLLMQVAWPVLGLLCIDMVVLGFAGKRLKALGQALDEPRREMRVLAGVLGRFEREAFEAPLLRALQARLISQGTTASAAIDRLDRLTYCFELQANQLFAPLAILLLWGIHVAGRLERWRKTWGRQAPEWIEALGQLEALSSLACYAYERPEYPFPEFIDDGVRFEIVDAGHPLIPSARCVRNSVRLDGEQRLLIVSGSNMSGKSTLLRTAGVNAVLALAGAPVCAARMVLSDLSIGATLRVHDSIQSGESRFFAEIKRIKQIMDQAQGTVPVLFLLDELLHGTNSQDRTIGGAAILRRFLERGAIGLVTTHDLSLSRIADELGGVRNVHFEDQVSDTGLSFDYRLKEGIVRKSNALELMRRAGLDV